MEGGAGTSERVPKKSLLYLALIGPVFGNRDETRQLSLTPNPGDPSWPKTEHQTPSTGESKKERKRARVNVGNGGFLPKFTATFRSGALVRNLVAA